MLQDIIIILIIGYLIGTFNTGFIIGKLIKKIDIREVGSQNAGASNATIVLGWKWGVLTAFVDILKATLAVYLAKIFFPSIDYYMFLAGLAVVIGHNYPFYMGFKGGKGTASVIGMFIAIDIKIALFMALGIIVFTIITDYIVIGTVIMYMIALTMVYCEFSWHSFLIALFLTILSIYKHRNNFVKILRKQEIGLRQTFIKKK